MQFLPLQILGNFLVNFPFKVLRQENYFTLSEEDPPLHQKMLGNPESYIETYPLEDRDNATKMCINKLFARMRCIKRFSTDFIIKY